MTGVTLSTSRLKLRPWSDEDLAPFAALNADSQVMEHFVAPLTREQSDRFVSDRVQPHFAEHGYGPWAVEVVDGAPFVGFVGLMWQDFPAAFTPALEVGWRLDRSAWGFGYATEAARAAVDYGFDQVGVGEIVSMTTPVNTRSRSVMQRLGMTHDPAEDFEHPRVPVGHPLRMHVLYRLQPDGRAW